MDDDWKLIDAIRIYSVVPRAVEDFEFLRMLMEVRIDYVLVAKRRMSLVGITKLSERRWKVREEEHA